MQFFLRWVLLSIPVVCNAAIQPPSNEYFITRSNWLLPGNYWSETLPAAKEIAFAKNLIQQKKNKAAKVHLENILQRKTLLTSALQDLVLLNLARLELEQFSNFSKTQKYAADFLIRYPESTWKNSMLQILAKAEIAEGMYWFKSNKKMDAVNFIYRGLTRLPWSEWDSYVVEAEILVKCLDDLSHPLLESFLAEVVHAIPDGTKKIKEIIGKLPANRQESIYQLALHSSGDISKTRGVRPIQPDSELFKNGMEKILEKKWVEALDIFQTFKKIYPESTDLDRVEYLIANCLEVLNLKVESQEKYKEILQNSSLSYYALEAALRTSTKFDSLLSVNGMDAGSLEGTLLPQQAKLLWRSRALLQVGLVEEASTEMESLFQYRPSGMRFGQMNAKASLALATFFAQAQYFPATFFHLRAAFQKDNSLLTRNALELYFPKRFFDEAKAIGENIGLDPYLILSIAKQESAFVKNAQSSAKALGLMQVLFGTAAEVDPKVSKQELFEIQKNIRIGAEYFKKLLNQFDGNVAVALAAYNAGPSRARLWTQELSKKPLFADNSNKFNTSIFIETIPYKETREYVGSILRNYAWYKFLNNETLPGSVEELIRIADEKKQNQRL